MTNEYEMMVLFDTSDASKNWDECEELVRGLITANGGEVTSLEKWGDRKLAYEINKLRRATYMLLFFNGDPGQIENLDRDLRLKERVLRHMILRDDRPDHVKDPSKEEEEEKTATS